MTIFFDSATINTWFIKLIEEKDLQSYTHIDLSEIRTLFNAQNVDIEAAICNSSWRH